MREIGPSRGCTGNPVLPEIMVFLNWKSLFAMVLRVWLHDHFWFALTMIAIAAWRAGIGRLDGLPSGRASLACICQIITQALTYALMLAFFR